MAVGKSLGTRENYPTPTPMVMTKPSPRPLTRKRVWDFDPYAILSTLPRVIINNEVHYMMQENAIPSDEAIAMIQRGIDAYRCNLVEWAHDAALRDNLIFDRKACAVHRSFSEPLPKRKKDCCIRASSRLSPKPASLSSSTWCKVYNSKHCTSVDCRRADGMCIHGGGYSISTAKYACVEREVMEIMDQLEPDLDLPMATPL